MNMNTSVFRRLMSVLLVLALIVGYMPASTHAAGDSSQQAVNTTATVMTDFSVMITRVQSQVSAEPEAPTLANGNVIEPAPEEEEKAEPVFTYEAAFKIDGADFTDKAEIQWTADDLTFDGAQTKEITGKTEIKLEVVYDGIVLSHTFKAADFDNVRNPLVTEIGGNKVMKVVLGAELTAGKLVRGAKVNAPKPAVNFTLSGGEWTVEWVKEQVEDNIVVGKTASDAKMAVLTLKGESGTEYLTLAWNASISDVAYQTQILANNSSEINDWYSGPVAVTVKITAETAVDSFDYIAAEVEGQNVTWSSEDGKVWTSSEFVVEKTTTVQAGSKTAKINIDTVKPEVKVTEAYKTRNAKDEKVTVVKFNYTVGESGVRSITINGQSYTPDGDGEQTATINGWDSNPEVVVTANNGLSSSEGTSNVQDALSIEFSEIKNLGEVDGVTYLSKDQAKESLIVTLKGADNKDYKLVSSEVSAIDSNHKPIGGELKYDDGKWIFEVSLNSGLESLSVIAEDAKGRTCKATLDTKYAVDVKAPVVKVSVAKPDISAAGNDYYTDDVTYTFTATDILLADGNMVKYTVNGVEKEASFNDEGKAKFTLNNGDKLTNINVVVKDTAGNKTKTVIAGNSNWDVDHDCSVIVDTKRPTVTAQISDNVLAFYSNDDGVFAVLKDTNAATAQEVVLTISASDANMEDATETFTIEIPAHATGVLEYTFSFQDLAGWVANGDVVLTAANAGGDQLSTAIILKADADGVYTGKIYVDRRAPSSVINGAPAIELKADKTPTETADGLDLFDGSFSYEMTVADTSEQGFDAGLKSVTANLDDGLNNSFLTLSQSKNADLYTLNVNAEGKQEIKSATLVIVAEDNVGNQYTFAKNFAVDTKAPEINYSFDQNNEDNHYKTDRTLSVTVTDTHLANAQVLVNGEAVEPVSSDAQSRTYSITFDADGTYKVEIAAEDLAGNKSEEQTEKFIMDQSEPVIKVEKDGTLIASEGDVDYYKGEVTYTVTVTDQFMANGYESAANLYYTFEDGAETTVTMGDWTSVKNADGTVTYTHKITVKDGQVLTGITVDAADEAGNKAVLHADSEDFKPVMYGTDAVPGAFTYTRTAVADNTAPAVTVTKTVENGGKFVQEYEGADYYNQIVTYHITVKDNFLNSCNVTAVYSDGSEEILENIYKADHISVNLADQEICEYEFSVDGSKVLTGIKIDAQDKSGIVASQPNVLQAQRTGFELQEGIWNYNGNAVVVDAAAPTATIAFSDNVDGFYMNGDKIYVILEEPAKGFFGLLDRKEEVTVTITVEDKNIAIGNGVLVGEGNAFEWTGKTSVNADSTLTYVASSGKVKADSSAVFCVDVSVADLSGNVLKELTVAAHKNANGLGQTLPVIGVSENGGIKFDTCLDFYRPSSKDEADPIVTLTPSITPSKTAAVYGAEGNEALDLFNGPFQFTLHIDDIAGGDANNIGMKYVKWTVSDPNNVVTANEWTGLHADGDYTIDISMNVANGESNDVTLYIEAMDLVGNLIQYTKTFGVDNLKPRITYPSDISPVASENGVDYYGEPVAMNVTIEDLNLDPRFGQNAGYYTEQVEFNSLFEVKNTKACASEDLVDGRRTLSYDKAGVYGITTYATDLAQNTDWLLADDNIFILDLEKPEIAVYRTIEEGAGLIYSKDHLDYYDGEVTYKVVVTDRNIMDAELTYNFEDGSAYTVSLDPSDKAWAVTKLDDDTVIYSYEFTVTDGQALTGISVTAEDKVQNDANITSYDPDEQPDDQHTVFKKDAYTYTYEGTVVVDKTAPVVTVEKTILDDGNFVQDYEGVDYYDQKVQYTFSVADNFLSSAKITAVLTDSEGNESTKTVINKTFDDGEKLADPESCEGSFVVEDGMILSDIIIDVKDHSDNTPAEIGVAGAERTAFAESNGIWNYTGNRVVVDTTAPTATIKFSDNVDGFYMNGDTIYVILKEPAKGFFGLMKKTARVDVTITAEDNNIAIGNGVLAGADNEFKWTGETSVNSMSTLTYGATSYEVYPDSTAVFCVDVSIADLSGNVLPLDNLTIAEHANANNLGQTKPVIDVSENGGIKFDTCLDFYRPSSKEEAVPIVTLTPDITPSETAAVYGAEGNESLQLFNGPFKFDLHIDDIAGGDANNIGMKYVKWTVSDPNGVVKAYESGEKLNADGNYVIDIPMAVDFGESNEVTLEIEAMDLVGNTMLFTQTFGVDNLQPRIEYTYSDGRTSYAYYNEDATVYVTINDLNLVRDVMDDRYSIFSNEYAKDPNVVYVGEATLIDMFELGMDNAVISEKSEDGSVLLKAEYLYDTDGVYALTTEVTDLAGNGSVKDALDVNDQNIKENIFIVDKTAPVIDVTKQVEEGAALISTDGNVDYYNGEVTYTVTIMDEFLNKDMPEGFCNEAKLVYTFEDGAEYTVALTDDNDQTMEWTVEEREDGNTYFIHEFTVTDGQVLTGITVEAMDNASNTAVLSEQTMEFSGENGIYTYDRVAVVDKTVPTIEVIKQIAEGGKYVQTYAKDGVNADYHDGEVTYTITVKDLFLDIAPNLGTCEVTAVYTDGTEQTVSLNKQEESSETKKLADEDIYVFDLVLDGSKVLKDILIDVKDNSRNVASKPSVENAHEDDTTVTEFEIMDDVWHYQNNLVVVDTTAPTAKISFSDNVVSFFTNNNVVYAILKKPVVADSGVSTSGTETVTMTVEVNDMNLALDQNNKYGIKNNSNNGAWSGATPLNADTTVKYQVSTTVASDGRSTVPIKLEIADLAGHWLIQDNLTQPNMNGVTPKIQVADAVSGEEGGKIDFNMTVDRRRSSSENDNMAPTITIKPVGIVPTTTAGAEARDLFAKDFKFAMTVTDGEDGINEYNSGVQSITWTITDANGVAKSYTTTKTNENVRDYDIGGSYEIPVNFAKVGESNVVTLNIEAVDNVGNTIHFEKIFGMDNLAPRVTITQSNHSVMNDFYFKDDQVVTVTIEDLNFEPTTSSVDTEVKFNGWRNVGGNKYSTVLTYNTDGDYTFAMETTDRANNKADIDYVTGLTALQKFTIDKTAPVINVSYNPAVPVGTDGAGVQYFDKFRTVTVSINEHNFNASEVRSSLGSKNALGAWRTNGDIHTASDTFFEGNNYSVSVQYTDLAGNPAQSYTSPTFSVDVTAPTIEITNGNMVPNKLNIVPDDLVLGLTINDAQSNMKDVSVEVLFTDSSMVQKTVEGAEIYSVRGRGDKTTWYVDFTNIEKVKSNDGIYTVRITATDYAGHVTTLPSDLVMSLNRFGSTFYVSGTYTENFLTVNSDGIVYQKDVAENLVVKEINPNAVWQDSTHADGTEGSKITVSVNGKATTLKKNQDYTLKMQQVGNGNTKWYEYTYSIKPDVFMKNDELVDGKYTIFFYSEDDAANKNSNESNEGSMLVLGGDGTYSGKIDFVLDHKTPVINVMGLDEKSIFEAYKSVQINIADNTPTLLEVYIDDVLVESVEVMDGQPVNSDWIFYDEATDRYMLNLSAKDKPQTVRVVASDAAGNAEEFVIDDIMLTKNLFRQYIYSTPAKLISLIVLVALGVVIYVLVNKRKKEEDEENAQN